MKRNYNFGNIGEAARYTRLESMRPGGVSNYEEDSDYLVHLFDTDRAVKGYGISEGVYVDTRNDIPYYIVMQYDGQMVARVWYLDKDELTFEEVEAYARDESEELYRKFKGIRQSNWKNYVKEKKGRKA